MGIATFSKESKHTEPNITNSSLDSTDAEKELSDEENEEVEEEAAIENNQESLLVENEQSIWSKLYINHETYKNFRRQWNPLGQEFRELALPEKLARVIDSVNYSFRLIMTLKKLHDEAKTLMGDTSDRSPSQLLLLHYRFEFAALFRTHHAALGWYSLWYSAAFFRYWDLFHPENRDRFFEEVTADNGETYSIDSILTRALESDTSGSRNFCYFLDDVAVVPDILERYYVIPRLRKQMRFVYDEAVERKSTSEAYEKYFVLQILLESLSRLHRGSTGDDEGTEQLEAKIDDVLSEVRKLVLQSEDTSEHVCLIVARLQKEYTEDGAIKELVNWDIDGSSEDLLSSRHDSSFSIFHTPEVTAFDNATGAQRPLEQDQDESRIIDDDSHDSDASRLMRLFHSDEFLEVVLLGHAAAREQEGGDEA